VADLTYRGVRYSTTVDGAVQSATPSPTSRSTMQTFDHSPHRVRRQACAKRRRAIVAISSDRWSIASWLPAPRITNGCCNS
ncbi:MAG: hypothetical protein VKO01_11560, partial [Cyanobacteriota bacterium]|nr:hypothetical protein [Cyanobacteriota bacterium]